MIWVLLLVHETAEETHRDAGASLGHALVRDDRLQAGLEQLLGHLRLQLEQVRHRRLVLCRHLQVRREDEVCTADLTGQAEVQLLGVLLVWVRGLGVLELVDVVVGKILLKGAPDVVRLLRILLVASGSPFASSSSTTPTTTCTVVTLTRYKH